MIKQESIKNANETNVEKLNDLFLVQETQY